MKLVLSAVLLGSIALADQKLGNPLTVKEAMPLATLMAEPLRWVGKTVQVRGRVTEVCEMAGCWMNLTDSDGHLLRIKVEDGVLVFPKDSVGKQAIAEGTLEKHEMSRDQLIAEGRHEAEESGRKFNAAKIRGGKTVYQIAGSGALILDK
ncbi:MAG: hypothetical protein QOJ99_5898 [Bryobacterales bacterium]|jgi:hypothetical protein|nr:hypothetical protein [Bryobacterales bacterium]